jgi:type II secretory pathway component PulC
MVGLAQRYADPGYLRTRAPKLVAVALAIALALQVLGLAIDLGGRNYEHVSPQRTLGTTSTSSGTGQLAAILGASLFGEALQVAAVTTRVDSLELLGTIAVMQDNSGFAIIAAAGGAAKLYRVGATIDGGALLASVYPDHVELKLGAENESLYLKGDKANGNQAHQMKGTLRQIATQLATPDPAVVKRAAEMKPPRNSPDVGIMRALNLSEAATKNHKHGLQVDGIPDLAPVLSATGLQEDDVITAIDGASGDGGAPFSPGLISQALQAGQPVRLGVERRGANTEVTITPERAAQAAAAYHKVMQD